MDFILTKRPEDAFKCKYEAELYRLKPRKRIAYEKNIELRLGLRYVLWSRYSRRFYIRQIQDQTSPDTLAYYIALGWLWLWPTEENKDEIRTDVKKSKRSYYDLMKLRQTELDQERHALMGHRQNAFQYLQMKYKQQLKEMR